MIECIALAGAVALFVALAAIVLRRCESCHYAKRLADKAAELERAYRRIDVLEQMLDESRAIALNVTAPQPKDARPMPHLPSAVLAELDEIDDPAIRAEMEADIRIELEAHPEQDPMVLAQKVIGG